jgi:hypothetical protein
MTQQARVLAALRHRGTHGITAADFAAGRVIDGQKPIMRVAARILELRKEGHRIDVVGERDGGCAVYRLMRDTQDTPARSSVLRHDAGRVALFEPIAHQPRNAIFTDDWEAA